MNGEEKRERNIKNSTTKRATNRLDWFVLVPRVHLSISDDTANKVDRLLQLEKMRGQG